MLNELFVAKTPFFRMTCNFFYYTRNVIINVTAGFVKRVFGFFLKRRAEFSKFPEMQNARRGRAWRFGAGMAFGVARLSF